MNYLGMDLEGKLIRLKNHYFKEKELNTSKPFLVVGGDGMKAKGSGRELIIKDRDTLKEFRILSDVSMEIVKFCVYHPSIELKARVVDALFNVRPTSPLTDNEWVKDVDWYHKSQAKHKEHKPNTIWVCPEKLCAYAER